METVYISLGTIWLEAERAISEDCSRWNVGIWHRFNDKPPYKTTCSESELPNIIAWAMKGDFDSPLYFRIDNSGGESEKV